MIHLDETRRDEAIAAGWVAHEEQIPGQREIYERGCKIWRVVAVCDDDKVIGALYERGGVVHLGIVPEYRRKWASRRIIRDMLAYGTKTRVSDGVQSKIEFAKRLGFVSQGDSYVIHR